MLDFRAFLEKGILPREGGLYNQHPLYVAAMLKIMAAEGHIMKLARKKNS
jgi:hypothetical protein